MVIRWFSDADRQDMADAREERRVLAALDEEYTTYQEDPGIPVTEWLVRWMAGPGIDPGRRRDE
ncbi:hypothetical protein GCM10027451_11090 [Geodermatophilus aquaeductus]|jgi:hypothetical protein|uniref:Uncharacterized protein n=1 Tax=Geodermatophilus aquaeductus TaxID=1564161 RepID=A0A521DTG4_9ACTN|nr:hypothetical protein [Geodermatophilus aquaeductus]SMO74140.1 hypothetical protein SAMN06273567_103469 [Geodermatophilus aquaeductus]